MSWFESSHRLGILLSGLLVALITLLVASGYVLMQQRAATDEVSRAIVRHHESIRLTDELRHSSDDLTKMVRSYVATGDPAFKEHFYTILDIRDGRVPRPPGYGYVFWDFVVAGDTPPGGEAGETRSLQDLMEQAGFSDEELRLLGEAKSHSDSLVELEEAAMRALEGRFRDDQGAFSVVGDPDRELALQLLFGAAYHEKKRAIMRPLAEVLRRVDERTSATLRAAQERQTGLTSVLVISLGSILIAFPLFLYAGHGFYRVSSAQLQESEERFRATFDQAAVGIAHVSTTGRFLRLNDRFCEIVGYTRNEMLARTFQDITHPEDLDADLAHVQRLLSGEASSYTMEKRYLRQDGETIWVNLTVSLLRDAGDPGWFVAVVEDIIERKQAEVKLRSYQRRLRALAADLTITEERERSRIARELHEGTVQELALARMQLDAAIKRQGTSEQVRALKEVSESLRWTALLADRIAADLSSPSLEELGLAAAISEWIKRYFSSESGIETELVSDLQEEDPDRLDFVTRAILFRNMRELLANVVRHARAGKVTVKLVLVGEHLELIVRDDGIGCDLGRTLARPGDKAGLGLFGVRERMEDLGGALKLESEPGKGFTATLLLPCSPAARGAGDAKELPYLAEARATEIARSEVS